jgi:hypothetical protein
MTHARRDHIEDNEGAPISEKEVAQHTPPPQAAPAALGPVEDIRWVVQPGIAGVAILQVRVGEQWLRVPEVDTAG